MDLVIVFGPPAVGKMTVGAAISRLTGWPLFHNHVTIEAVLSVFGFGHPAFWPLVLEFRQRMFEEAINHRLAGMIYTFAWSIDDPADHAYISKLRQMITATGGRMFFAELKATWEERVRRNEHDDRLRSNPSKRNLEASRQFLTASASIQMNSTDPFWFADYHLCIDNTDVSPEAAAVRFLDAFRLPRL